MLTKTNLYLQKSLLICPAAILEIDHIDSCGKGSNRTWRGQHVVAVVQHGAAIDIKLVQYLLLRVTDAENTRDMSTGILKSKRESVGSLDHQTGFLATGQGRPQRLDFLACL